MMCLTIPVQVKGFNETGKPLVQSIGTTNLFAVDNSLVPDIKIDDWLLCISGLVLKKIPPEDALEIIDFLKFSNIVTERRVSEKFSKTIRNAHSGALTRDEIIYLLNTEGSEAATLYEEALLTRQMNIRDFICIHGVIEFSNYCSNDCLYCGLRAQNQSLKRYRMAKEEIIEAVFKATAKGYKLLVLQSGEDMNYDKELLGEIIKTIKSKARVFIFLSIGERGYEIYKELKNAGASGILLRFETSDPELFKRLHEKGKDLKNRLEHLNFLKTLGYFIATGFLVGLPGQTLEILASDILTTVRLAPEMVSVGPYIPSMELEAEKRERLMELTLKVISILRLLLKRTRIPISTALDTIDPENGRKMALRAGANALMFILTPEKYRSLYSLYPNRYFQESDPWERYGLFKYERSYDMLEERLQKEI